MTTRDEWLALAARCEAAKGADREIDEAIREAAGYPAKPWNYTDSIDAITALVERRLPEYCWSVFGNRPYISATLVPRM